MTSDDMRAELAARFAATAEGAPLWLPPALRESIVAAGLLEGGLPEVLAAHYTVRLPAERAEQIDERADDGRVLLRRRLELGRLPHLREALDGAHAALAEAGIEPARLFGAAAPEALVAARPTLGALYAPTLFGDRTP